MYSNLNRLKRVNALRTALFALMLMNCVAFAQDFEALMPGVVRIESVSREGKSRTGTRFVVKLDKQSAYILTAWHVVKGDKRPKVFSFSQRHTPLLAEVQENDTNLDISLLIVRGNGDLHEILSSLQLEDENVKVGDTLATIGFPAGHGDWAVSKLTIGSRRSIWLKISGDIDEGNSGGPLLRDGKVVAMLTSKERMTGQATPSFILRESLRGWGVDLSASDETAAPVRAMPAEIELAGTDDGNFSPVDPHMLEPVKLMTEGAWVVPLAQFNMTNRSLVVAWPALTPDGQVIDNNAYDFMIKRESRVVTVDGVDKIYGELADYIEEATGGAEYFVYERNAGAPEDEIGDLLESHISAFVRAHKSADYEAAIRSAVAFSRLFSLEIVNNPMTKVLIRASDQGGFRLIGTRDDMVEGSRRLEFQTSGEGKRRYMELQISRMQESEMWIVTAVHWTH